jgi:2'-5' RNA ligase
VSESGERRPGTLRLFFALWPSDRQRAALAAAAEPVVARVEGEAVPRSNFHLTLAFLGFVPRTSLARLIEIGGQGPWPTPELAFERIEYWAKPRVLVALPARVPAGIVETVDRLWRSLEPLGIPRETRPWRPHLTLVRRVRRPPPDNLALAPVEPVGDAPWRLALVESTTHPDGARYRPVADWPLGTVTFSRPQP